MKRIQLNDSKKIFDVIFEKWFYLVGDIKSLIIEDYNDAISYKVNYLIDEKKPFTLTFTYAGEASRYEFEILNNKTQEKTKYCIIFNKILNSNEFYNITVCSSSNEKIYYDADDYKKTRNGFIPLKNLDEEYEIVPVKKKTNN